MDREIPWLPKWRTVCLVWQTMQVLCVAELVDRARDRPQQIGVIEPRRDPGIGVGPGGERMRGRVESAACPVLSKVVKDGPERCLLSINGKGPREGGCQINIALANGVDQRN